MNNNNLRKFGTQSEYIAAKDSLARPNVCYIEESLGVAYNPILVPEMVDLGLTSGTKWMAYNLGAEHGTTAESWYGNFYAFGETQGYTASQVGTGEGKKAFSWADYELVTSVETGFVRNSEADKQGFNYNAYTKDKGEATEKTYYKFYAGAPKIAVWDGETMVDIPAGDSTDNDILTVYHLNEMSSLDAAHDAISAVYGSEYHMPTKDQIQELIDGTNHEWVSNYEGIPGLNGRVFISKTDMDRSIFIPAVGYASGGSVDSVASSCDLWSREVSTDDPRSAWGLGFGADFCGVSNCYRCGGRSVRGVK